MRFPFESETYAPRLGEPGAPGEHAFASIRHTIQSAQAAEKGEAPPPAPAPSPFSGGVMFFDHPMYHRPISATENFYVEGKKPSSVFVVEGGDRGCIAFVASVHAGSNAKNAAEAEAKKRGEDPADADRASWHAREVAVGEMPVIDNY